MNILITGGAGFGGSGLARRLLARGHEVSVMDITAPAHAESLAEELPRINYIWKAVQDMVPQELDGIDVVAHLAAQADVPMGITSSRWTLEQCTGVACALLETIKLRGPRNYPSKVIYASTGNCFGRHIYLPIDEEHPLTPHNPYAAAKAAAELYFRAYERAYGIPIMIMSNGIVTGPGMRREIFLYKWLWNMIHGLPVKLEGGDQTRDITYVDDVMDAWVLAVEAPCEKVVGEKFQVSYGEEYSVAEILEWCFEITGAKVWTEHRSYRPGEEGQRECFSNEKARRVLGYEPKVPPKEAIRLTYEWMKTLG